MLSFDICYYLLFLVLRLSYYFVVVLLCYYVVSCTSITMCRFLSQMAVRNNLSTSEVGVKFAYTIPSLDPTL